LVLSEVAINKKEAWKKYQHSLQALRRNPTNPDSRGETLRLGRAYSKLTRDKKGNSVFDEVALMNDIQAACAAAAVVHIPQPTSANQIQALADLAHAGIITPDEFSQAKAGIIGKPASQVEEATKLIQQLHGLYKQGVLSEGEFNLKKWDVLSKRLIPKQ
jgi:hypothetical protein